MHLHRRRHVYMHILLFVTSTATLAPVAFVWGSSSVGGRNRFFWDCYKEVLCVFGLVFLLSFPRAVPSPSWVLSCIFPALSPFDQQRSAPLNPVYTYLAPVPAPKFQLPPVTGCKSKNAFSRAVFSRLVELLERAEQSEAVVAVVLTGAKGYFTSGADIKELQTDRESVRTLAAEERAGGTLRCVVVGLEHPFFFGCNRAEQASMYEGGRKEGRLRLFFFEPHACLHCPGGLVCSLFRARLHRRKT